MDSTVGKDWSDPPPRRTWMERRRGGGSRHESVTGLMGNRAGAGALRLRRDPSMFAVEAVPGREALRGLATDRLRDGPPAPAQAQAQVFPVLEAEGLQEVRARFGAGRPALSL